MTKCQHPQVESHHYVLVRGEGIRCTACHAVMQANAEGSRFIRRQGRSMVLKPIPLDRKYWKEYVNRQPDPMSYEARMRGYENIRVVRR